MLKILWQEVQAVDTGEKALRSFGLLVGAVLIGIALVAFWKFEWTLSAISTWLAGIGAVLVGSGLLFPRILKGPYRVWMGLAVVLGFVMTRLILTAAFYLVITPTGLLLRLSGKDPLKRAWEPEADTYWIDKHYDNESPKRLERYY